MSKKKPKPAAIVVQAAPVTQTEQPKTQATQTAQQQQPTQQTTTAAAAPTKPDPNIPLMDPDNELLVQQRKQKKQTGTDTSNAVGPDGTILTGAAGVVASGGAEQKLGG